MNRRLHLFAVFTAAATFFLILAGALVTSTGSGLAVPDWPLSYGQFFPPMVGGIFYEHGHRMVAGSVAILTVLLLIWVLRAEKRRSVRVVAGIAVGTVISQAILGGLTVLFFLPTWISVAHACLAQTFLCLVLATAILTSRAWRETTRRESTDSTLVRRGAWLTMAAFVQLALGAWMRHTDAGLAIPDFPLVFGGLLPSSFPRNVSIHFSHRVWAIMVFVSAVALFYAVWKHDRDEKRLVRLAFLLGAMVTLQILLGGYVIWSMKAVWATATHVVLGAGILATALTMTLLSARRFGWPGTGLGDFVALTKPRVTGLVCFTAAVGFWAARSPVSIGGLLMTVLATAMVASGASALNQYMEREIDARMARTAMRPLPTGRLRPAQALRFGILLSFAGLALYALTTNPTTLLLAMLTEASYLFVYTPLKRVTPFCTILGAVPGALPPVIGWAAAGRGTGSGAWVLFAIVFLWQLPHFWAIAWMYREDYERGGIPMLPSFDPAGGITSRQLLLSCGALLATSLLPTLNGETGILYLMVAIVLGLFFLNSSFSLARLRNQAAARRVLLASVAYLPMLLVFRILDRL